jgi:hypothetical protein
MMTLPVFSICNVSLGKANLRTNPHGIEAAPGVRIRSFARIGRRRKAPAPQFRAAMHRPHPARSSYRLTQAVAGGPASQDATLQSPYQAVPAVQFNPASMRSRPQCAPLAVSRDLTEASRFRLIVNTYSSRS